MSTIAQPKQELDRRVAEDVPRVQSVFVAVGRAAQAEFCYAIPDGSRRSVSLVAGKTPAHQKSRNTCCEIWPPKIGDDTVVYISVGH